MPMKASDYEIIAGLDATDVSRIAARLCEGSAERAIGARGTFTLALSGGSTPQGLYTMLAMPPFRHSMPWQSLHLFWSDERCVPPTHPDSNYRLVKEALLARVPIPSENINRIPAELEDPQIVADTYEQTLRTHPLLNGGRFPRFDLVLLGLGQDGHTASLFPGTEVLNEKYRWVEAPYVAKLSAHRITLTPPVINHAATIAFLVTGESKAAILKRVLEYEDRADLLPAQLIRPEQGKLYWLVDRAAASRLDGFRGALELVDQT